MLKKILSFLIIIAVSCQMLPAEAAETIDIGLFYGSSAKLSVRIYADGAERIYNSQDVSGDVQITSEGTVSVEGTAYKGAIILKKDSGGKLTVINRVDMEDYIASVTAKEMSPSFNMEALKAQAVCARTYAVKNKGKHGKYGFDLCTTQDCQVYYGSSAEAASTIAAAQQTAGQLVRYNGEAINAVYSATSGGHTEDALYVWGSDHPYLKGVPDSYESKDVYGSAWQKEITAQKATEIMASKGYNIGNVKDIQVLEATKYGTVTKLKVTGTEGEKIFTNESCRLAFGSVTLSQAFTVTNPVTDTMQASAFGGMIDWSTASILSADGQSNYQGQAISVKGGSGSRTISRNVNKDVFIFNGRGFGHLVGLSQNGANGMAAAGYDYKQILQHYYQGTEIY